MSRQQTSLGSCPDYWKVVQFDTIAELKHGYQFRTHDFTESGTKVFKITQIKGDGSIDINNCSYIDSKRTDEFSKFIIKNGDILMALSGATIGKMARFKSKELVLQNYRVGNFIPLNEEVLNKDYFYYFLTSDIISHQILANQTQSAQENVGKEEIHKMTIFLPPLPEQQAIAEVLSSLDDKIDLLHRNNKTLEQMAETLFRQWFVVEAKEEWETVCLKDTGKIVCGKTPSTKNGEYFNGPFQFVKIPDMHGCNFILKTGTTLTEKGIKSQANKTIPEGSIMVSCIATVGLVSITTEPCQTNQQINSILPSNKEDTYYLFLWLKNNKEEIQSLAGGGSVTDNLNTTDFGNISIPYPDEYLRFKFNETIEPLFNKIKANSIQIQSLSKTRDTLLPKLMSGQVRVELK